ncbi:MAG TPA: hypothetical protein VG204_10045 [Terriglobia bacterium]|nr:hypothetical protein [Terriglobia bacterium]
MKRNIARRTLLAVFAATLVVSAVATARAEGLACSIALAAGKYSFIDSGTVVGVGPRSFAGILTLDAAGNVTNGKGTSSLNGSVAVETFSGTYTVNPDCTGTFSVDIFVSDTKILSVTTNNVFDDNMRQLRAIFTSAVVEPSGTPLSTVIALDARKLK